MVLMRGVRVGTLYKMLGSKNNNRSVNVVVPEIHQKSSRVIDSTILRHRQMGHINEKNLCAIPSKSMVEGVPDCSS